MKNNNLSIIHVDEDLESLQLFRMLVAERDDIEYVGGFTSASKAMEFLENAEDCPDLVFLDIRMPEHNGIEVAMQLTHKDTDIVFLTSHTEYAIRAFEICALDYVLKPINRARLDKIIDRYRGKSKRSKSVTLQKHEELISICSRAKSLPKRICINMQGKIQIIRLADVIYFTSVDNYTHIIMANGEKHISSKPLLNYIKALTNHTDFLRVHKSYFVNKNCVDCIIRDGARHKLSVRMTNGIELPASYSLRDAIVNDITN